ncbi:hypothetical protein BayCH28_24725 [Mycolicibacterium sp. CH28]|uniref:hypothetical protein n=1 Tax=Mycolicibacterium sp. CH28 TaxID=2512237 RepID=UPI0010813390|nr:hypothetical protein [Mycolicibacterium sp. CH28]TGD84611.1 hypothetical protein BayCH28_24725 [Mycolicibacterium sp. CH28]
MSDDLGAAVAQTVQWFDATRLMPELGVTCAVEMWPGHVLTRLNASNVPGLTSPSLQADGLDNTISRIHR